MIFGALQLVVVYFSVRFALKLRDDAEYFGELWQAHLHDDNTQDGPAPPAPEVPVRVDLLSVFVHTCRD